MIDVAASPFAARLAQRDTPRRRGYWQPAEWERHEAVWSAWPSHEELWREQLAPTQAAFLALCQAIVDVDPHTGHARGERLELLVPDEATRSRAQAALRGSNIPARCHLIPFGDIWLRDTAPIFLRDGAGHQLAACFNFNGWAGKYVLPHDAEVAEAVAAAAGLPALRLPLILEGGSVEVDGQGTCLTTRQCLLHPGRNPAWDEAALEVALAEFLGVEQVIWLDEGLQNDHTDGHIDTLARYVAPGVVVCMEPQGGDDPNRAALLAIIDRLRRSRDARGQRLTVETVPSPGAVVNSDGRLEPASYVNFYIGNTTVVVPTYGVATDEQAVQAIAALFPTRRTVGVNARALLSGGGAFHCITQQLPHSCPTPPPQRPGWAQGLS